MIFPQPAPSGSLSRVAITGAGIITALGAGWRVNASGLRRGEPAFRPVTLFDVSRQRAKLAGEVRLDCAPALPPGLKGASSRFRRLDRSAILLLHAAYEAWQQSGWVPTEDLPVVLGTTSGGMALGETYYRRAVEAPVDPRGQPSRAVHYQAQSLALDLLQALGCAGPATIIANACASGANAIGHAWHLIRHRRAGRVLAGGCDALTHLVFAGFDALQALSPTQCRPFDADRDGLGLGEGAAVLAVENWDCARDRGAEILGEIVGYGASTDVHHLTQPHPEGDAALRSMREACASARMAPEDIDYVNAHGTGTLLNDSAEAIAIRRWAGAHADRIRVSSTKSSTGHLLGAAGAVEAVVCLMALREQWIPPTTALLKPDPICAFQLVSQPMDAKLEHVLSNSFGFGGANATLILRRTA